MSKKTVYNKYCTICGDPFSYIAYPSVEKANNRQTCSETCRRKLVSQLNSGKWTPNGHNTKRDDLRIVTPCKQCGAPIKHLATTPRTFCSRECKGAWQKANLSGKNNPNWKPANQRKPYRTVKKQVRRDLIQLRGSSCELCKSPNHLQVHHKDRNRGNNHPDNLLLLCIYCHANTHLQAGEVEIYSLILAHPSINF